MWADTLLALERDHLLRLLVWGAASIALGTVVLGLLAVLARRGGTSALLRHFAIQQVGWGLVVVTEAWRANRGLELRDSAGYVALDRSLWLNVGLDVGFMGIGATLALTGWLLARRQALVGAGTGVVVQGIALCALHLILAGHLARLVR
jgi:hypothetical protein